MLAVDKRSGVGGEGSSAWTKAKQKVWSEGSDPDCALPIAGNLHEECMTVWHSEQSYASSRRIEAAKLVGARFGEPDHPLWIDSHAIGVEGLHTRFGGKCIVPHVAAAWIEPSQAVGVEFSEPDIAVCVERQFIRRARQGQRLACMSGIRDREPGQGIELIVSRCGKVVPKVVGKLFGKPDGVVGCDLDTHDAMMSTRRCQVPEGLVAWIKDDQGILAHGSKPDPPLVVDGWSHHLAIRLR